MTSLKFTNQKWWLLKPFRVVVNLSMTWSEWMTNWQTDWPTDRPTNDHSSPWNHYSKGNKFWIVGETNFKSVCRTPLLGKQTENLWVELEPCVKKWASVASAHSTTYDEVIIMGSNNEREIFYVMFDKSTYVQIVQLNFYFWPQC